MPFDKDFFEKIESHRYLQIFPYGAITMRLKKQVAEEYRVARILDCGDRTLTFTYYDKDKEIAWPPLTVSHEVIISVDFKPGKAARASEVTPGIKP